MSALIVCLICDRQRKVFDPYGISVCSNCGVTDPRIIRNRKIWQDWDNKYGVPKIEAQRRAYAGLKWLRDQKGYKNGYASAKFKGIFGYWPPQEIEDVPPSPPFAGLSRRIAVDNARWTKQKRAEERANPTVVEPLPMPADGLPSFMTADDWTVKL